MDEQLILDRYRLIERIASGGSAEVWRARDEQLSRDVAVKRLHPHLLPDEASRKRLAAEARAAAGLSHPVVVGIYDVDATGESPALIMELVDGESLGTRILRDGPLAPRQAVAITADLAEALFHAHTRGVIHRDVKPGNVLLSNDGRTRLVDFGIAHSLAASAERLTLTGTVIGTLHAMAPEQLAAGPITPRTDLYGLGVVLHEALTGRPPYPASSPVALADAQRAGPPSMAGVESALAAVIVACLAFDPAQRPLHAGALAAALRDWLAGEPAAALALAPVSSTSALTQPISAVVPAAVVPVPAALPSSPARDQAAPRRSRVVPLVAVIGLLLLGAAALAALRPGLGPLGGPSPQPTPSPTPTVTATPAVAEWMPKLVEDIARWCDGETTSDAAAEMVTMSEDGAREFARDLVRECRGGGDGGDGGDD
jgi:serine/threonine-protein kinase